MKQPNPYREQLYAYVKNQYMCEPEYPWMRFPDYAVFRHAGNRKWFGLVMDVPREKLGLEGSEKVEILNVKLQDPLFADVLIQQDGFFKGYHISRGSWISVLLDGTVPMQTVFDLLHESYVTTAPKPKAKKKS